MPRRVKGAGGRATTMVPAQGESSSSSNSGGGGSSALLLAHGFSDNGGAPTPIPVAGVILASVTVTPKVSGKFKLSASVAVQNNDDSAHHASLQFGHGGAGEYPPAPNTIQTFQNASSKVSLSLNAETGSTPYPFVAPLNAPVTFNLFGFADIDGELVAPVHGAQFTVEELPN